jgi:hypothetical protein
MIARRGATPTAAETSGAERKVMATKYYSLAELRTMDLDDLRNVADDLKVTHSIEDTGYRLILSIARAQRAVFDRTFEVEMLAFSRGDPEIRIVKVPSSELNGIPEHDLERVFYWGQNDFQQVSRRCSVSMGDVVRMDGERWRVEMCGFVKIAPYVVQLHPNGFYQCVYPDRSAYPIPDPRENYFPADHRTPRRGG